MRKLSREEKRIVNMLFNHLFTMEYKIRILKLLFPSTTTDLAIHRKDTAKINEIFDCLFSFEDKIEGIKLNYEVKGYNFESIEDIIENRELLEENEICTDWKTQRERRKQKPCYV